MTRDGEIVDEQTDVSRTQIMAEVKAIVAEHMQITAEKIGDEDHLVNDIGCDSLDLVEISMKLEEHFALKVPDELAQDAQTIAEVTDSVLDLLRRSGHH
ncbi:MAG: acyl carrier protein [Planctomycetes bacterium]|nr:acyl carrier protein [Planctomycetota bacterium]